MKTWSEAPFPSADSLRKIDEVVPLASPDDPAMAGWFRDYSRHHRDRLAFDIDHALAHLPAGGRILEYGSVPPLFTAALARSGYQVFGLDLAPGRCADALRRLALDVAECDIEKQPVPHADRSFDGIVFNEVFEHLRINLIYTLREALRVLKPGGTMLLSTPNLWSLRGIRNFLFRQQAAVQAPDVYGEYAKLERLGHMGHVREYTPREVTTFLGQAGFRVEALIFRGEYPTRTGRLVCRLFPSMRPGITVVARKDGAAPGTA